MRRDSDGTPRPGSIFVCDQCKRFNDVNAEHYYARLRLDKERRLAEAVADALPTPAAFDPDAIKHAWLEGADLEQVPDEDIPDELVLLPGTTEIQTPKERRPYVRGRRMT